MLKLLLGNPYVLIGIGALIFLLAVGNVALYALWDGAAKGEKAARLESGLHEADATRWQDATTACYVVHDQLKSALDQQSALTEQGRAKEAELRTSLDNARQQNDRLSAQADQLSRDLEDEATKAPGDVRELGPIVARRAPALFE